MDPLKCHTNAWPESVILYEEIRDDLQMLSSPMEVGREAGKQADWVAGDFLLCMRVFAWPAVASGRQSKFGEREASG